MVESLSLLTKRHKSSLLRLIVMGGMIGLLAIVGYVAAEIHPFVGLAVIVVPIGVSLLVRRIELGLVGMLLAAVLMRFRLPTGTASEIVISLLICGGVFVLWLVHMLVEEKKLSLKPSPVNAPLLGFIITVLISLIWGRVYRDIFVHDIGSPFVAVASAAVMVLLPVTLLMVANLVRDERWLQVMVWLFLGEGLISLIIELIIDLGIGPTATITRLVQYNGFVWINTHGLFSMWYLILALALAIFHRQLRPATRAALLIYAAAWLFWGFGLRTSWLSGWVPAFVASGVVVFFRSKKWFVVLVIVAVVAAGGYYLRTAFEAEAQESGFTRLAAYEVNWRITSQHLLFGTGPAGYASYYMSYFPAEGMATHSNYIDIIAQTGIVGSFFILWFFFAQARGGYRLRRELEGRGDFAESLTVAVLGGSAGCVVAMGLGDWLFPFAYTQTITGFDAAMINWFFMGTIWALRHTLHSSQKALPDTDGVMA